MWTPPWRSRPTLVARLHPLVDGTDAPEGTYPYQVSVRQQATDGWHPRCGGSVIGDRWILTTTTTTRSPGRYTLADPDGRTIVLTVAEPSTKPAG
ncbi:MULTISPECIES: trypsin-like serine protease [unclassified Streptomyces]|uniref:trypsin-like serine protease n=1 Tax=unclassified Streptomyces TaxID=2593676 RepID=UPI001661648A|nr:MULTISPECIES: trypsin-like serine protease [unclassified Streptomyces]MBD0708786.1 hypothetical protein [Streptomyces sp. CBMA291]MBD0714724.1 hypothetical protein [Streptomyces sp. CBMA370]